jgi:transcriptional regulator with XRE-family HTH domain
MNTLLIAERLREERKRLGLTQERFGAEGGVGKLAQLNYEKGERSPDAAYLSAIALVGVDVSYVLTGERCGAAMTPDESALLAAYRALDARGKQAALGALSGLRQPVPAASLRIAGDIGQYFEGDQTGAVNIDMSKGKGRKKRDQ